MTTRVCVTVDFEPDCPPYLQTGFRGITEGGPALLELFREQSVVATYFSTGEVAEKFPDAIEHLVADGHELACHGHTHTAFAGMHRDVARWEIEHSAALLRRVAPVQSFRAPYLRFPDHLLGLLTANDFTLDSSIAKYKHGFGRSAPMPGLVRIPASVTSSALRLPAAIRNPWLRALSDPVVLFVHPWEFVDLRNEALRIDCRFRTGTEALNALRDVIALFRGLGASFLPMQALLK